MQSSTQKIKTELAEIERTIAAQEQLAATLPPAQQAVILDGIARLRKQQDSLRAQLAQVRDGAVAQGPGAIALGAGAKYIVHNYLQGSPQLDEEGFRQALARYLTWLDESYGWLTLRGIKQRDQQVLTLPLDQVYTSLSVGVRGGGPTVDVRDLLWQGQRLIITGAPGSGKSTVLQYIAWTLARTLQSGRVQLAVERLGFRIPQDEEGNPQPEKLELPLPVLIPLHAYAEHLRRFDAAADPRKTTLTAFISDYLIRRQAGLGLPADFFEQLLVRGQNCLLLLDGLDEVPDEKTRVRVSRAVEDLVHAAPGNRVIVTSRPAAYEGQTVLGARFRHLHLQPMSEAQVTRLVTRLYRAAITDEGERARETANLLRAIDRLEKLRARLGAEERFITTPLLVRMIVIVHFSRRQLPEQRAELYREVVDTLLAATYHPDIQVAQALAEWGGAMSQRRNLLGVLAFHMHSQGQGTRTIGEAALKQVLQDYLTPQEGPEQAARTVEAFVASVRQRGSFLDERSGQYQFLHLSFQEFLAARHLAETVREVDRMAAFLEDGRLDDPWWREPALLLLGYLSSSSPDVAARLARRLARMPAPGAPDPGWPPLSAQDQLAGAALAAAGILEQPNAPPALRRALADRLTELLTAGEGPKEWAATGRLLARLGDPRPGVGLRPDGLPDIVWCEVPAGPFLMGEGKEQHEVHLPTFYIARYPVTNAQFAAFAEDGGYARRAYWAEAERAGYWKEGKFKGRWDDEPRDRPKDHGEPFNLPNHPVVGVSWYEALAFCRWLTEQWRLGNWEIGIEAVNEGEWQVMLPSEAEWEKAARGGMRNAQFSMPNAQSTNSQFPNDRRYPWGDELDANRANTEETGIGTTSAVGCFPRGASPYGVEDLSGNVWEWTRSLYRNYPYNPNGGREELNNNGPRVLRGGSFYHPRRYARCAARFRLDPDIRWDANGLRLAVAPAPLSSDSLDSGL